MAAFGRRNVISSVIALAAASLLTVTGLASQSRAQPASPPPPCSASTTVPTATGPVCGVTAHGQTSYLDIPYAAPPLGALRWQPPRPARPWTATYQATRPAPECPAPKDPGVAQAPSSENCLTLKVQRPAGARPGENLPVIFEIHGGGFLGTAVTDNGSNLVSSGPAVYVFANYRLGILGFLADAALGAHSGDYGLQDQQAALRWTRDNIARFGGNPRNVTILGESAGGASVCDQIASPAARGLFQRGISVSGFYNYDVNTVWWPADCKSGLLTEAQAQKLGASFAAKVGCGKAADVAACLRAVPAATLAGKGGQFLAPAAGGVIGPIVNGTTLPMPAAQAFELGRVSKVPLIIGVGRDEFNGGKYANIGASTIVATTPAQYRQLVDRQFGSLAPTVMKMYPIDRYPSPAPFIAYRTIMADAFSACPALASDARMSRSIPVYAYTDDDSDSPAPGKPQVLGAYHSAINRLVHDDPASLNPDQAALLRQVLAQWTGFARDGQPSAPGTPPWPPYTTSTPSVMSLQPAGDTTLLPASTLATQHHCTFWNQINQNPPSPSP